MKKILGIICLIGATLLLLFGFTGKPNWDIHLWVLIPIGLFLYFMVEEFSKKEYSRAIINLVIALIIANKSFHISQISSGVLLCAGLLICQGVKFLSFDNNIKNKKDKNIN